MIRTTRHTIRGGLLGSSAACFVLFVVAVSAAPADSGPGTVVEAEYTDSFLPNEVRRMTSAFFDGHGASEARYAVRSYRLRYMSTDFDGSQAQITAQLFVPVHASPPERPVLVFGAGTTGLSDSCAPSLERPETHRWGYYRLNMLAYAGEGFITILPDYLGFDDPTRTQRYFSKAAEAHVLLDAVRAVYNYLGDGKLPAGPSGAVFAAGYSQGGHAAFAAADLHERYAPEVPLTGVIGFGATTDVAALLVEGPCYAPYVLQSYSEMYGAAEIDPARVLLEPWAGSLASVAGRMSVDQVQEYYPANPWRLFRPEFLRDLYAGTLDSLHAALQARLRENRSGLDGHGLPALIVHGRADTVVSVWTQTRFVQELRSRGSEVQYAVLDGIRHRYTRMAGFRTSVQWMERLAGAAEPAAIARSPVVRAGILPVAAQEQTEAASGATTAAGPENDAE